MKLRTKRKATDGLPTNLLAVLGLYSIWRALCGKSRFDMPEGSGYRAGMELKGQMGMDGNVYKTGHPRGPNLVTQNGAGERIESSDGKRWAISRNRKRSLGNGLYDSVKSWDLKQRTPDGKVEFVDNDRTEEAARGWVNGGPLYGYKRS
jgi:hypothetical protein